MDTASIPSPRRPSDAGQAASSLARASTVHGSPPSQTYTHQRRPSVPMSPSLLTSSPRAIPVPVPQRHGSLSLGHSHGGGHSHGPGIATSPRVDHGHALSGSFSSGIGIGMPIPARGMSPVPPLASPSGAHGHGHHRKSGSGHSGHSHSGSSFGAASVPLGGFLAGAGVSSENKERRRSHIDARPEIRLSLLQAREEIVARRDEGRWLDITGVDVLGGAKVRDVIKVVGEDVNMEEAAEALLSDECHCLLVKRAGGEYAFFDFADLNTFLLLVLHATSGSPKDSRSPSRSMSQSGLHGRTLSHGIGGHAIDTIDELAVEDEPDLPGVLDDRARGIVRRLRRMERVTVGSLCDISGKNPYQAFPATSTLRTLLPLFASGLHKIALTSDKTPEVLTDLAVMQHLISLESAAQPSVLALPVTAPSVGFPLHPLISLPGTASVLDAMQVMSQNGLTALGVLSGSGSGSRARRESSGSSGSSSGGAAVGAGWGVPRTQSNSALSASPLVSPATEYVASPFDLLGMVGGGSGSGMGMGELLSVVSTQECTRLVVPSEGKQVLGMGLEQMVKRVQYVEEAGRSRGEERVPVHTIPHHSTILHAAHLILATSSSRVFLRSNPNGVGVSPELSPTPSLSTSQSSPPSSPSLSSLSLSDSRVLPQPGGAFGQGGFAGLPPVPPTQLSPHYVVSTLDILSCLARAYHDLLTPPPGVRPVRSGSIAGVAAEVDGRERDKNKDKDKEREREMRAREKEGMRTRVPRSRLRGSVMIVPHESGGVGGWELDEGQAQGQGARKSRAGSGGGGGGGGGGGSAVVGAAEADGGARREGEGDGAAFGTWRWARGMSKGV